MSYFNLFSNILITKGATRVLLSDLQRNVSELYPLEFYEFIDALKQQSIEDLIDSFDEESREIAREYVDLLVHKEFGFITKKDWDRDFPALSYRHQDYDRISNMFIELKDLAILKIIKRSIANLEVKHLVIYCREKLSSDDFIHIDKEFDNSPLQSIEVFSPYHNGIDAAFCEHLDLTTERIHSLVFYSCPEAPFEQKKGFRFSLNFSGQDLKISSCGKVDLQYFNTNQPKVLEAMNFNSCLHKKMGIDIDGTIKNCPCMQQGYGNINEKSLEDALAHPDFKKYWNLTKDNIAVCRDCEYRYVCTDCRAYTERSHVREGLDTSKPLKCGYDPYTGKWEAWSTNPLKQQAITYYGFQELN